MTQGLPVIAKAFGKTTLLRLTVIDVHLLRRQTLYIIILYIFVLLYKSNKIIQMFFGKFADEGDNLVDNPNIYNVEGDNRLSSGLLTLTTGSVLKILFFQSGSILVFYIQVIILLSSAKQNILE